MAKDKFGQNGDNQHFGDDNSVDEKFEQSAPLDEEMFPSTPSDKVTLVFKQNRKKELRVGRGFFIFDGAGSKVEVDRSVVEHPDFENQKKYFLVKEA